jgi:uncharacterized protein YhhL (DUF1145 family)
MWQGVPLTIALTRFTFGFHVLLDLLCEWETLIPKVTPFPQISHFAIRLHLPFLLLQKSQQIYFIRNQMKNQGFFKKNKKFFLNGQK